MKIINVISGILPVLVSSVVLACEVHRNYCDDNGCKEVIVNCASESLQHIPVTVPPDTTHLNLAYNSLDESSLNRLEDFIYLVKLSLGHNNIQKLLPGAFKGLRRLKELDLRYNPLCLSETCFPENSFTGLVSLETLNIVGVTKEGPNGTKSYPVRALLDLPRIRHLYLYGAGDNVVFPEEITRVKTMEQIQFYKSPPFTLTSKIVKNLQDTNISTLFFKDTGIVDLEDGVFSNFTNLKRVGIAGSLNLTFSRSLQAFAKTHTSGIDTLLLEDLGPTIDLNSPDFCNDFMSNIKMLSIRNNRYIIGKLTPELGKCLFNVEYLAMGFNVLFMYKHPKIRNNELLRYAPPKLKIIDISCAFCVVDAYRHKYFTNNTWFDDFLFRISEIPVDKPKFSLASANVQPRADSIYIPKTLQYIFMNDISLTQSFKCMPLYFEDNNIVYVSRSGFKVFKILDQPLIGLNRIQVADLSHSGIESITGVVFKELHTLRYLNLSNNLLGNTKNSYQGVFSGLRSLIELDLSENGMDMLHDEAFINLSNLRKLKLNNNIFRYLSITVQHLRHLKLLNISFNQIPRFGDRFTQDLDALHRETSFTADITGNPLLCDCQSLAFITWIQNTRVALYNKDNLICSHDGHEEKILHISIPDLKYKCSFNQRNILISAILSGVVLLFAVVSTPVIFKYRWHLRWYYYSVKLWWRRPEPPQEDTPLLEDAENLDAYDFYVVYASQDSRFVTHVLRDVVEEEWHKTMFIWERDALAGGAKADDIVLYQRKSEKILIYLTSEFIKDNWCVFDFNMALLRETHKIIIIYMDGTELDKLPRAAREILNPGSGYQVIEWSNNEFVQNFFWRSLKEFVDSEI